MFYQISKLYNSLQKHTVFVSSSQGNNTYRINGSSFAFGVFRSPTTIVDTIKLLLASDQVFHVSHILVTFRQCVLPGILSYIASIAKILFLVGLVLVVTHFPPGNIVSVFCRQNLARLFKPESYTTPWLEMVASRTLLVNLFWI